MIRKYTEIFCWKNVSSFCSAKATHIFSAKNIRILFIESAKTVNEITLNELVKLMTPPPPPPTHTHTHPMKLATHYMFLCLFFFYTYIFAQFISQISTFRLIKAFFKRVKFFQCYTIFLSILSTILNTDVMHTVVTMSQHLITLAKTLYYHLAPKLEQKC